MSFFAIRKRAHSESGIRPKALGLHDTRLANPSVVTTPPKVEGARGKPAQYDSANFEAAKRLVRVREDSGLSQEELAAASGEHPNTIGRRERGEVHLGPLRQVVVIERASALKAKK